MNSLAPCPLQHFLAPRGCFRTATKHGSVFWDPEVQQLLPPRRWPVSQAWHTVTYCWRSAGRAARAGYHGARRMLVQQRRARALPGVTAHQAACSASHSSTPFAVTRPAGPFLKESSTNLSCCSPCSHGECFHNSAITCSHDETFPFWKQNTSLPVAASVQREEGLYFASISLDLFYVSLLLKKVNRVKILFKKYLPKGVMLEGIQISKTSQPASTLETQNHQKVGGSWIKFISKLYSLWPRNKHCCG